MKSNPLCPNNQNAAQRLSLIPYICVIGDLLLAYRAIKAQKAKQNAYKRFIGKDPDYGIIQALINEARVDVVATVTFPNGTKLDLKRADEFDKFQKIVLDPDRAAAY